MSGKNRYQIQCDYQHKTGDWEALEATEPWYWDTWQDAIHNWLTSSYEVLSETPSEDGRSGIIEIQLDPSVYYYKGAKVTATLIED